MTFTSRGTGGSGLMAPCCPTPPHAGTASPARSEAPSVTRLRHAARAVRSERVPGDGRSSCGRGRRCRPRRRNRHRRRGAWRRPPACGRRMRYPPLQWRIAPWDRRPTEPNKLCDRRVGDAVDVDGRGVVAAQRHLAGFLDTLPRVRVGQVDRRCVRRRRSVRRRLAEAPRGQAVGRRLGALREVGGHPAAAQLLLELVEGDQAPAVDEPVGSAAEDTRPSRDGRPPSRDGIEELLTSSSEA